MTSNIPPDFEIELSGKQSTAEFVKMFLKNQAVRDAFETAFSSRFASNPIFEEGKIFVSCSAFDEDKDNVIKAFEILETRFTDGLKIDSSIVKMIADTVIRGNTFVEPVQAYNSATQQAPSTTTTVETVMKKNTNKPQQRNDNRNDNRASNNNDRRSALGNPSNKYNSSSSFNQSASPRVNVVRLPKYVYEPRSEKQREMAEMIRKNDLVFGLGPAGTGKTHVAVALAIMAYQNGEVDRIVIARPALQAGEDLGFMKGDKNQKLEEYMRPIYDIFDQAFGPGVYLQMIEDRTLDIVAVGQMRGRTFPRCFVILDEAQNCTKRQMYMALTRPGDDTKMVVTGDPDPNQIDLADLTDSGLAWASAKLDGKPNIAQQVFEEADVVRSDLVKTIVNTLGADFKKNDFSISTPKVAKKAASGPKA